MRTTLSVLLVTSIFAAACGGAQPAPTGGTPEPTAVPTVTESAAPVDTATPDTAAATPDVWKEGMTKDQQVAFMKAKVMPKMTPVFNGHDATKYASVTCVTCHGPQYKEPKEFLPKLTFKDGAITSFKDKPEISKWMAEKVVPEMAAAMGQKPFDPATKTGFGCGGCHTVEMK